MAPRPQHRRTRLLTCAFFLLLACLTIAALFSCQKSPLPVATPPQIHRFQVSELAELGGYLEDLDQGRLSLAPPVAWHVQPRDKDHVARFVFDRTRQSAFPRITVDVRDAGFPAPSNVTEENLLQLFDRIKAALDQNSVQTGEGPQPLMVGQIPCVRYVVKKSFQVKKESGAGNRSFRGDREVVETLAQGRIYSVILDSYEGKLADYRADAYAVVAGLRFQHPASTDDKASSSSDGKQEADGVTSVP